LNEEVLKFPCDYPIKVMGKTDSDVEKNVLAIVKQHFPEFNSEIEKRLSRDDNYVALTITVHATSRQQLEEIYMALTQCKDVLMTL